MKRWWQKPINAGTFTKAHVAVLTLTAAIIVEVLLSPAARVWFGAVIIGSALVAIVLHIREKDEEL